MTNTHSPRFTPSTAQRQLRVPVIMCHAWRQRCFSDSARTHPDYPSSQCAERRLCFRVPDIRGIVAAKEICRRSCGPADCIPSLLTACRTSRSPINPLATIVRRDNGDDVGFGVSTRRPRRCFAIIDPDARVYEGEMETGARERGVRRRSIKPFTVDEVGIVNQSLGPASKGPLAV